MHKKTVNLRDSSIWYYYIIMATLSAIPAMSFLLLHCTKDSISICDIRQKREEPLYMADMATPLGAAVLLLFMQSFLYFGILDAYSNLITSFAVLGPLHLSKTEGVYLASLFWGSNCIGRFIGKYLSKY